MKSSSKTPQRSFVFVTGPYSAPTSEEVECNIQKATEIGRKVFQRGYYPIVPHLLIREYYKPEDSEGLFGYESLMQYTFAIISKCDILLIYEHSPGADREWKYAESLGKKIYFNVEQMPEL